MRGAHPMGAHPCAHVHAARLDAVRPRSLLAAVALRGPARVREEENAARATATIVRLQQGVNGRKRRPVPRAGEPDALKREYGAKMQRYVRAARTALAPLLEALPRLMAERAQRADADTVADLIERARKSLASSLVQRDINQLANDFAAATSRFQKVQLQKQLRAALGADVLVRDTKLRELVGGFVKDNVALIQDVPRRIVSDVEKLVREAVESARPHPALAKQIEERFRIGEDRAKMIARDQVGKLYGQINAARQKAAAPTSCTWR